MPNKSYEKGRRFEYRVRNYLTKQGMFVVRQAKSAFPDLIAIDTESNIFFIECKVNKYLSSKEKKELNKSRLRYGVSTYVVYPIKVGRESRLRFEAIK